MGYRQTQAPVYGTRFASGDRDYNDLSQWWYLTQTDWSGGFKEQTSFEDDAKFYYSSNIDARTKPGTIRLERQMTAYTDWVPGATNDEILDVKTMVNSGNDRTHVIFGSNVVTLNGSTAAWDSDGTPSFQLSYKNYQWLFGTTTGNGNNTPYPFTMSSKSSQINGIIDGSIDSLGSVMACVIGGTLFVAGVSDTGNLWVVKTTNANPGSSADWTLCAETPISNSLGASITGIVPYGSGILLLVEGSPTWTLSFMDISTNVIVKLKDFTNGTQTGIFNRGGRYLVVYKGIAIVTLCTDGTNDENGEVWTWNGSTLTQIYKTTEAKKAFSTREGRAWLRGGAVEYDNFLFWGNLVYDGEHFYNFIKDNSDNTNFVGIPVGTDGQRLWMTSNDDASGEEQELLYEYDTKFGTTYKQGSNHSAFIVFSQHDKLQSIDKLLHSVNIGFEQFAANQEVRVYYSTNQVPDPDLTTGGWTLIGTASHTLDGASATFKTFLLPSGVTAKKVWFRIELSAGGSDTPTVTDFTLEYLPIPDYRKEWNLVANCADEVKRLDGSLVETTARELRAKLERSWMTKSQLDYQDLDYASTTLSDNPLTDSATTITVASTADFPEQGRIRIENEDIFYTGKTPTQFTGCTRGARGTKAVQHAATTQVHNGYKVVIMGIESRVPITLEDKHLEYTFGLTLREV